MVKCSQRTLQRSTRELPQEYNIFVRLVTEQIAEIMG